MEVKAEKSLEEMTIGELGREAAEDNRSFKDIGKGVLARQVNIELLLPMLGDRLEREALSRYKHNDDWAIRGVLQDSWKTSEGDNPWGTG